MRTTMTFAAAALAAAIAAPAAAGCDGADNMHFSIRNELGADVKAIVLQGDETHKQELVESGGTHRFKFEWCYDCCGHDKTRTFEIKSGSKLLATGKLEMKTNKVYVANPGASSCICEETNIMTFEDEDTGDDVVFAGSTENGKRTAVLTVDSR